MGPPEEQKPRHLQPVREGESARFRMLRHAGAGPADWSALWAGLVVSIGVQLLFVLIGSAIGLGRVNTDANAQATIIWAGGSLLPAIFFGGYVTGLFNNRGISIANGVWHGVILWALMIVASLALSLIGGTDGATGFLGIVISVQSSAVGAGIALASLFLALGASVLGNIIGSLREPPE